MGEELLGFAFLGCLGASVLAVVIGAWMRPNKGIPGWVMVGCTLLPVFGVGLMFWHAMDGTQYRYYYVEDPPPLSLWQLVRFPLGVCLLMVAALGFAFGFLVSRKQQVTAGKEPRADGQGIGPR